MATKKEPPLPTTFLENHRHYELSIFHRSGPGEHDFAHEGEATSAASVLRTLKYEDDGIEIYISAHYKQTTIGQGNYRKRGAYGSLDTLEMLNTSGAIVGMLETEMKRQQEAAISAKLADLPYMVCPCGHAVRYDAATGQFYTLRGQMLVDCDNCGKTLNLTEIQAGYERRIAEVQRSLAAILRRVASWPPAGTNGH